MPITRTNQPPKSNFPCSQTANARKKHSGNSKESPNCVTHSKSDRKFILYFMEYALSVMPDKYLYTLPYFITNGI
jgi:hypothetical protein